MKNITKVSIKEDYQIVNTMLKKYSDAIIDNSKWNKTNVNYERIHIY